MGLRHDVIALAPLSLAAALALSSLSCSADATTAADASRSGRVDARRSNGIPDASRNRPDARSVPVPDAEPTALLCDADTEPNDTQATATSQAAISDCDAVNGGGSAIGSVIKGNEDWFTFVGTDGICSADPVISSITGAVNVCLYVICSTGTTEVACPADTTPVGGGLFGCCGSAAAGFAFSTYNCAGTINEDATMHLKITTANDTSCEAYTVDYHF